MLTRLEFIFYLIRIVIFLTIYNTQTYGHRDLNGHPRSTRQRLVVLFITLVLLYIL